MKKNLLSLGILLPFLTIAQSNEEPIELSTITVSASMQPLPVAKTGRNITSFAGEQFQNLPVHSIDDLLRYIPGVEIQQRGPAGSQSDIVLRGGTFQQVLVILDGVRLNDPNTGHFNSYIPIHPNEIERIEVLKGASSAIYGSEAVGGVINILTKTFTADRQKKETEIKGQFTGGEYGLWAPSLSARWQNKETSFFLGAASNNAEGQPQRGTHGFFHNNTVSASVKHHLKKYWSFSWRTSFDNRDFAAQNFYTTFLSDTASEKVKTWWHQAGVQFYKGKHKVQFTSGYKSVIDEYAYNASSIANNSKSYLLQTLLTDHIQLNETAQLTAGIQFQNRKIKSNDRGEHNLDQAAAFLIYHQSVYNWSFSPSLRLDYGENRGTHLIPQLNISYHKNKWQLRGSIGTTIRDADFTERYNNYGKALVTGGSVGNPILNAEKSLSYEMGADFFAKPTMKFSATLFQRQQQDVIDWVTTPYANMPRKDNLSPTGTFALAQNISEVTTSGLEADVVVKHIFNNRQSLFTSLGILWLDSKTPSNSPSFYIASHAKFLTNLSLDYRYKNWSLALTGIYKSRATQKASSINANITKDYFVLNAQAKYGFWQQKMQVFARVDNLLNEKYSDLLGAIMPVRWAMAGINFQIR